jgi:iron complex transport system substrate-binding protein
LPLYLDGYIVASKGGQMPRRALLAISMLWWPVAAMAGTVVDATGRNVEVAERIGRILPAGPPAATLLAALAPDLMLGWTSPVLARGHAIQP